MTTTPSTPTSPVGSYRWVICALLFFATTINYMDRQILSLLKPILDDQLKWTNTEYGVINSVFQGAYGIGLLWFGWFIDRYGTKIGYAVSIAGWSIAAACHALVFSVTGFGIARVGLGLSEGGNFPSAIKAVAQWFPKRERAFATSIFNSGANVGAIAAPVMVPWIAATWGWHMAFILAGAAGFVWLFFWMPLYNVPEKCPRVGAAELDHIVSDRDDKAGASEKMHWGHLLSYRQTWSFIVAKFMTDPIWWFFLIWLPDYFKKTRGMDLKDSQAKLITIYVIVTILSIIGGWITGYFARMGWTITKARKVGMAIFAVAVLPIYAVTHVGVWPAVFLIGLGGAAHQAWSANLFTTVSDMFPKKAVASVVGIGGLAGATGGMLFPILCGKLLDHFEALHSANSVEALSNSNAGYSIIFAVCAFAYVVTFVVHHLLAPSFKQIDVD